MSNNSYVRFSERAADPLALRGMAAQSCRDLFATSSYSHRRYTMIMLGPAELTEAIETGEGEVVSKLWEQEFLVTDEDVTHQQLLDWYNARR